VLSRCGFSGIVGGVAPGPALTAAIAYVVIIVLALFADFLVLKRLTDPNDAAKTVSNIASSEVLFRGGVAAFIIVFIADVVVAWGLYVLLRRTSRELPLFAAWFRLIYVAVALGALLNLLLAVRLVGAPQAIHTPWTRDSATPRRCCSSRHTRTDGPLPLSALAFICCFWEH
jgi:phosphoglycerol transferase MdoB-like AlkP superfamily enzyme